MVFSFHFYSYFLFIYYLQSFDSPSQTPAFKRKNTNAETWLHNKMVCYLQRNTHILTAAFFTRAAGRGRRVRLKVTGDVTAQYTDPRKRGSRSTRWHLSRIEMTFDCDVVFELGSFAWTDWCYKFIGRGSEPVGCSFNIWQNRAPKLFNLVGDHCITN